MRLFILMFCFVIFTSAAFAQKGYTCSDAIPLTQLVNYCSNPGQYGNADPGQNGQIWFTFTAADVDLNIIISGQPSGGTINTPSVHLYTNCNGIELPGATNQVGGVTSFFKSGLTPGQQYYILINSKPADAGTFKLCVNSFSPPTFAGQDCSEALFLCNTNSVRASDVVGAGTDAHESAGTCLDGDESNTFWYKWKAGNNGTLVFTITPDDKLDDIDFVLYDLDTAGNCNYVDASHAIRCAAGHGVDCNPGPVYYKTGLDFKSTDVSEASGCGLGQDGKVEYITLTKGHVYGLLINNYTSANNGFTLGFTDQNGNAGTGVFAAPGVNIKATPVDSCQVNKTYTFSAQGSQYTSFDWDFGSGATVLDVTASGEYTVQYASAGNKTITVNASTDDGCASVTTQTLPVPDVTIPPVPVISINQPLFCPGDTIRLSTNVQKGALFHWLGPGQFQSTQSSAQIIIQDATAAGTYYLYYTLNHCDSPVGSITVPPLVAVPVAAFTANVTPPVKLQAPATVTFINQSTNADAYLWNFGDGSTSTDTDPVHEYDKTGIYTVKLTAFDQKACSASVSIGTFTVRWGNTIFIPNTFTPNGDGINDLFNISITNLINYRIQIFNRQGQLLYDSRDVLRSWDGTYDGKALPIGTYYYVIDALGKDNNTIKESGYIALVR